jgi:uncharacterized protein YutE (UPF0331/DUF86 family)
MSPLDVEIIQRKLAVILENLKALEAIQGMKKEEYIRDIYRRKATERLLQELIEAAIDINTHTIVETGHTAPDDYYQSFILAGEIGIIPPDLAETLAPSAGLRNRLVHEYDVLDHETILTAVGTALKFYPQYLKAISDALSRQGKDLRKRQ